MSDGETGEIGIDVATDKNLGLEKSLRLPPQNEGETNTQYLMRLEKENRFLFHGSPYPNVKELEPREAQDLAGDPWRNDKAVFAVPSVAIAIQRAILPKRETVIGGWKVAGGTNPQKPAEPLLEITPNIKLGNGVVYVLDRPEFEPNENGSQWKSKNPVKPLSDIPVNTSDYKTLGGKVIIKQ